MRSLRVLAVAVLAVVLALSSAQNVFATVQLYYDNGTNGAAAMLVDYGGVLFSLPSGVSSAHLTYVRWYTSDPSTPRTIYITKPDGVTQLSGSPIALGSAPLGTGCPAGWGPCYGLDVTSFGIVVTGEFFVIMYRVSNVFNLQVDTGPLVPGHSFYGVSLGALVNSPGENFLIRVDIDPIVAPSGPVGGFMEPVNKLAVFAPYLALLGVIGAIAVVFWKRPDN
jgi:hypothetical protein